MKILWLGKFDGKPWRAEYFLSSAVRNCGADITEINYYNAYNDFTETANNHDIVLIQGGRQFPYWFLYKIVKPIVFFASEANYAIAEPVLHYSKGKIHGVIAHSCQVYNTIFNRYRNVHLTRIHNGFSNETYSAMDCDLIYDICFVGANTSRRKRFLDPLKKIYGNKMLIAECYGKDANLIYNQSKIVLHIHAIDQTYLPTRFFEVMSTNALFVCENIGDNWDGSFGLDGVRFFVGKNDAEKLTDCKAVIDRVLKNESDRKQSVLSSQAESYRHTWEKRGEEFYNFIIDVYKHPVERITDVKKCYDGAKYF